MPTANVFSQHIYQVKITLLQVKPPIWRRLLIPGDMTMAQFHNVIQAAMGWTNSHLHEFQIGEQRVGVPDPEDSFMGGSRCANEKTVRFAEALGALGARGHYTYDFGDGWEHSLLVEKALSAEPAGVYPLCTAGKRNCPPEDCGGPYGYSNLLDVIADAEHPEHEGLLEWLGGGFNAEEFSVAEVNMRLAPLQKRRARAAAKASS
jgi:hypothetical protein